MPGPVASAVPPRTGVRNDVALATVLMVPVAAYALLRGDPIYIGVWYYPAILACVLALAWLCAARPWFRTGACVGQLVTLAPYWALNLGAARPEGLLGVHHLYGLIGAGIGLLLTAGYVRARAKSGVSAGLLGLAGCVAGFFVYNLLM